MTAPALPAFCNSLFSAGGADKVNSRGVSLYGTFTSIDQLFTFLFVGFWGAVSDHVGRKPLIVMSSSGVALGWLTVALSTSLPFLYLGRAVDGVTSCMLPLTQSMVRDLSPAEDLGKNLGRLQGLSVGFAFIVGAMSGGILTQRKGPRFVFKCAAAVAAFASVFAVVAVPESLPGKRGLPRFSEASLAKSGSGLEKSEGGGGPLQLSEKTKPIEWNGLGNPVNALKLLGRSRTSIGAAAAFLLFWAGLNGIQINLFNYAQYRFGWSKVESVKLQALSGVVLAIGNSAGPALLLPRLGRDGTVRLGMALMAACLGSMAALPCPWAFRVAVCGASAATACLPVLMATVSKCYSSDEGGAGLAALETANTLNRVAAYWAMSRVFGWSIAEGRPPALAGSFFGLGSALVLVGLGVYEVAIARTTGGDGARAGGARSGVNTAAAASHSD